MTITVTQSYTVGGKSTTTTATAEIPDTDYLGYSDGDDRQLADISKTVRALVEGMKPEIKPTVTSIELAKRLEDRFSIGEFGYEQEFTDATTEEIAAAITEFYAPRPNSAPPATPRP